MTRVETETGLHLLFLQKAPEFETREKRKILNFHEKVVHIHRVFVWKYDPSRGENEKDFKEKETNGLFRCPFHTPLTNLIYPRLKII